MTTQQTNMAGLIDRAYRLEAVLRVTFDAVVEEQVNNAHPGLSTVLDMAADMAAEILSNLERSEMTESRGQLEAID